MPREVELNIDPEIREPHFEGMDPARLRLFEDGSGRLRLTVRGQRSYLDVKVAHAFPFSVPDRYVGFLDGKDKLIVTVPDPDQMDEESRRAVERHLRDPEQIAVGLNERDPQLHDLYRIDITTGERELIY
ncbi:MAG: DUF1854 domain-containing protein, partial [Candidatus Brocadiia bacterium]